MSQKVDPITLQVLSGAFDTIAEEMGHILYRMSFSSIIRESQDLGAGLFDVGFNTLCESESTPLHIGSLPGYLAGIQESLQGGFHITQPGSTVATSLIEGEAAPKKVGLLDVRGDQYRLVPLPLNQVRAFVIGS